MPRWRLFIDLPPVWLGGFAALAWIAGRLWPVELPLGIVIGWAFLLSGLALMAAAIFEMRRHRTTVVPHMQPSALVTTGVFAVTRNPIYLGDALVLTGLAVLWDAPLALALVPVFMRVITRRFILDEERRLHLAFGDAFDRWAHVTPRWLWPRA